MKVSVIIPIYNTQKYIERCLNSIIANTYKELEIICVDDGSTDQSREVLDAYVASHTEYNIRIIHKENGGVSIARNVGLDVATGDYISFIDSDDVVSERYFEILLKIVNEYHADIGAVNYVNIFTDKYDFGEIEDTSCEIVTMKDIMKSPALRCYAWGKLFRKDCLKNIRFTARMTMAEDACFNAEIYLNSPDLVVAYSDQKLYGYYENKHSAVHTIGYKRRLESYSYFYYLLCEKYGGTEWFSCYMECMLKYFWQTRYIFKLEQGSKTDYCKIKEMIWDCYKKCSFQTKRKQISYWWICKSYFLYHSIKMIRQPWRWKYEKVMRNTYKEIKLSI